MIWRNLSESGASRDTVRRTRPEKSIKYQVPRKDE